MSIAFLCSAQVAINPTGANPNSKSALDIDFPGKGLLIPRMDESTRDTISNVPLGLMIFNTTTNCFNMWDGSTWKQSCFDCSFALPTVGNNGPICEGQTLNLTATNIPGASYSWTGPNGFSSNQQNPSISNAAPGASGVYSLVVTLNGCSGSAVTTSATVNASPTTPVISTNSPVCSGDSILLSATSGGGATFSWTGPNGYSASGASQSIFPSSASNAGSYNVVASVSGCTSTNSATVSILNVPNAPGSITGDSTPACNASSVSYSIASVAGATSYTWSVPTGATVVSGQGTNNVVVDFGSNNGNICVTASNSCGISSQTCEAVTLGTAGGGSQTFTFTGAEQTFTVPPCVTSITIEAWGAQGGAGFPFTTTYSQAGGKGGYATGTLSVTPGQTLYVNVGEQGVSANNNYNGSGGPNAGGYNGGGTGSSGGGGGGGASHVASSSGILSAQAPGNVYLVAGAGGGGVWTNCNEGTDTEGGAGGGTTGAPTPTAACGNIPGSPGTQSAGGSYGGSFGQGGDFDPASTNDLAGGGGGWYGGGSGSVNQVGGGGSSYTGGVAGGSTTNGLSSMPNPSGGTMIGNTGNGVVKITW